MKAANRRPRPRSIPPVGRRTATCRPTSSTVAIERAVAALDELAAADDPVESETEYDDFSPTSTPPGGPIRGEPRRPRHRRRLPTPATSGCRPPGSTPGRRRPRGDLRDGRRADQVDPRPSLARDRVATLRTFLDGLVVRPRGPRGPQPRAGGRPGVRDRRAAMGVRPGGGAGVGTHHGTSRKAIRPGASTPTTAPPRSGRRPNGVAVVRAARRGAPPGLAGVASSGASCDDGAASNAAAGR